MLSRREALTTMWAAAMAPAPGRGKITFGVVADVHQDVMHDAGERLRAFARAAEKRKPDFNIQLGDFCRPYEHNREFLSTWNSIGGPRYHVLGNHEIDGGFTWAQSMEYLGMKAPYYSFDLNGWHFVVLDGNEKNAAQSRPGYPRYIGEAQLAWLAADLKSTQNPTIVFSHQSLEDAEGVENNAAVRAVLESANKVAACFSGHHHIDFEKAINGIHYVQINSMSYYWMGDRYPRVRYSAEIDKQHPYIKYTAPYASPLYAFVTLDPRGRIEVHGTRSTFVGPSPAEMGYEKRSGIASFISDRKIPIR